jgi:hypothetical protein
MNAYQGTLIAVLLLSTTAGPGCATRANDASAASPARQSGDKDTQAAVGRPNIPDELAVPEGRHLAFSLTGRGVQIYQCRTSGGDGAFAWTLVAPRADLLDERGHRAGTHYAGPTWEAADGSKVTAKKLAEAIGGADTVPWLLLQAASHEGDGRMSAISYIQRVETEGGRAPTGGCSASADREQREITYSALYNFYSQGS